MRRASRFQPFGRLLCGLLAGLAPIARGAEPGGLKVEELRRLTQVLAAVRANHVAPVDDRTLIEGAIRGLVVGLDAQSAYLDAAEFKELQVGDRSAGIGLELQSEDGLLKIVAPLDHSPAAAAGLRAGDVLLAIDGWPAFGKTTAEAARRLRGPANSAVELTVRRPPAEPARVLKLRREPIKPAAVRAEFITPDYAVLRVPSLRDDTAAAVADRLRELYRQHQPAGLVLDLRDNTGGLFNAAIALAAVFLPHGASVAQLDSRVDGAKTLKALPADYAAFGRDPLAELPAALKSVPLVVLVNNRSAAGSEIIAGALQDHRRARLIGTPTYGLDSIQTVFPLPRGGALKLTTARWRTPLGRSVAPTGLRPDFAQAAPGPEIEPAPGGDASPTAADDPLLRAAMQVLQTEPQRD